MTARTLVIGEALIDIVQQPDGSQREHPGGSPMNVAIGLARLAHPVHLATWVGQDEHGAAIRDHLARDGVQLCDGGRLAARTPTATARMDARGQASYDFDLTWDVDDSPAQAEHVHTGSLAATLHPGAAQVRRIVQQRREQASVSYDPNARPSVMGDAAQVRTAVEEMVGLSDLVKASDEDIAWLYGPRAELAQVLQQWCAHGPAVAVATCGERGAIVHLGARGESFEVAGRRTEVADTIGAGDAFMSGLISGLLDHGLLGGPEARQRLRLATPAQLAPALDRAVQTSSITVSRSGAQPPTRAELD